MSTPMDDELYELFVQEGQEHIELLQSSLLRFERDATDTESIRDAFRAAHSLKGMAAAMGMGELTRLLHAAEDLLGTMREGELLASPAVISALFDSVDLSSKLLDAFIAGSDAPPVAVDPCIAALVASKDAPGAPAAAAPTTVGPSADVVDAARTEGMRILQITIHPDPASLMPAARAFGAVLQAHAHGDVVAAKPTLEELEVGTLHDGAVTLWLATGSDIDLVDATLGACTEIQTVTVTEWHGEQQVIDAQAQTRANEGRRESDTQSAGSAAGGLNERSRTVRVDSDRLDSLMHSVGEFLVRRSRVENIARRMYDPELLDAIDEMSHAARELQAMVMDVRMVSIDIVLRRLPRLVRDLERTLGKDVDLQLAGGGTELDRTVIDLLGDPLVHLVRNAMDHGIESPAERLAAGKPERGTLAISASAADGLVLLRVRDDGRGMDPDVIRRKAIQRGIISEGDAAALSDDQALQLCFTSGFTTRDQVSELSGRGVGLDVVRASVRSLGGDVLIDSSDAGTQMTIKLPLTLAIVPVLLVRCAEETYALPVTRVRSIVEETAATVTSIGGRRSIDLGDTVLGVSDLARLLDEPEPSSGDGSIVLLDGGDTTVALRVDTVLRQEEVVTRPIPTVLRSSPYLSASATLGDGDIAFLLDTEAVAASVRGIPVVVDAA